MLYLKNEYMNCCDCLNANNDVIDSGWIDIILFDF